MMNIFAFTNKPGETAQSSQSQSPGNRIIGMDDREDPFDEFVDTQDFVDVALTSLKSSKYPKAKKVGTRSKYIGKL